MPLRTRLSDEAVDAQADALAILFANGYLRIYDGEQPESADTLISGQQLLSELRFAPVAFKLAVRGIIVSNPLEKDLMANATGKAMWFRCFGEDGTSVIMDGSVGEKGSGANLEMNSVNIQAGAEVEIDFFQHRVPKG